MKNKNKNVDSIKGKEKEKSNQLIMEKYYNMMNQNLIRPN